MLASAVAEHALCDTWDSVVVAHGLSRSVACEIFPDLGSNCVLCIGRWILNHWTPREVPHGSF